MCAWSQVSGERDSQGDSGLCQSKNMLTKHAYNAFHDAQTAYEYGGHLELHPLGEISNKIGSE